MLVAGIMLDVRIGHKRDDAVKNGARGQQRKPSGVKRRPRLERQDQEPEDEHQGIEREQGE